MDKAVRPSLGGSDEEIMTTAGFLMVEKEGRPPSALAFSVEEAVPPSSSTFSSSSSPTSHPAAVSQLALLVLLLVFLFFLLDLPLLCPLPRPLASSCSPSAF